MTNHVLRLDGCRANAASISNLPHLPNWSSLNSEDQRTSLSIEVLNLELELGNSLGATPLDLPKSRSVPPSRLPSLVWLKSDNRIAAGNWTV